MRRPAAIAGLATIVAAVPGATLAAPALAAYPGENGKIAFVRDHNNANAAIYTINPDGTGATQLTEPWTDRVPTWSPDGNRIAFTRSEPGGGSYDIYTMNADGTAQTRQTVNSGIVDRWPTWSPDGTRIAFVSTRHPPPSGPCGNFYRQHDVYVMNQDGSGPTRLTTNGQLESHLAWSPFGDEIALRYASYEFDQANGCNLVAEGSYTVNPATGVWARWTDPFDDWSPDGSKYVRGELSSGSDIYVGTINNSEPRRNVTNTPNVNEREPAWSPDGRQIVFSTMPPPGDLWIMDADGSNRRQLTATPNVHESAPDWQPVHTGSEHIRPTSASRAQFSLVPRYEACTAPNRQHGPPLAHPSCAPPRSLVSELTMSGGTGPANSTGMMMFTVLRGAPGGADDTDVSLRLELTNLTPTYGSPYTGEARTHAKVRVTDRKGSVGPDRASSTISDFGFEFDAPCVASAMPGKSDCSVNTSFDAQIPGSTPEGTRAVWELDQVTVRDGGPDGNPDTFPATNRVFAVQGVFIP